MKTTPRIPHPAGLPGLILSLAAILVIVPFRSLAAPDPVVTEPKTHTLFMGADFDLQVNKDFCRVQSVSGDSFVVNTNGSQRAVPMNEGLINLKVQQSLKLTEASATIDGLKGERAYTPANDPRKKFMRSQPGTTGQDAINYADGHQMFISNLAAAQGSAPRGGGAGGGMGNLTAAKATADTAASTAGMVNFSEANNMGAYVGRLQQELAEELFDAMEVTFAVSSEKPLSNPYVVIVARFHERDAQPGKSRNWIFAKALAPIDSTPRKIRIMQGGLPLGFVMEDFKIHLYDRGQELATNVADKRVALTRDEAFQYLKLDYLSSHKGATLPPDAALGKLPADFRTRLTGKQAVPTLFVQVSKEGLPVEAFVDESCSQKVTDVDARSAIMDLRFQPALDKGKAVEGTYRLNLTGARR
jgi:hypothetical protein